MDIGYDPLKNAKNVEERSLNFEQVLTLRWDEAYIREDARFDYPEDRFQTFIEDDAGNLYIVIYTVRGRLKWIISFRRANTREKRLYDENT